MSKKPPTAEEAVNQWQSKALDYIKELPSLTKEERNTRDDLLEAAFIEFAKLHVKAALKEATKTVEEYRAWGDKEMINNCYPDKLIK